MHQSDWLRFETDALKKKERYTLNRDRWRTQEFCSGEGGGVQQIQLRPEGRENGDLGAVAP
jgi:hypothetical protein